MRFAIHNRRHSINVLLDMFFQIFFTERSAVILSHSITKTLQNGSRQLRTDRNLPRNSTDRPKDKVCVTGSDSFRKRVNRVLSRSRERNPKAGTDNHDIGNQHRRATCLAVLHIYQSIRKHPARFFRLAGCFLMQSKLNRNLKVFYASLFYFGWNLLTKLIHLYLNKCVL